MLDSVIFDMDGVLIESHDLHRRNWRQILDENHRSVTDAQLDILYEGATRAEILRHFLGEPSPAESARLSKRKDELFIQDEDTLQMMEGLDDLLLNLEIAGIRKAVATSASRQRALRLLNRFQLTTRFAAIITSAEVTSGKEDPAIFKVALDRLGAAPENCLVIEDSPRAICSARRLGIHCVGVSLGSRVQRLLEAGADRVVPNFKALTVEDIDNILHCKRGDDISASRSPAPAPR